MPARRIVETASVNGEDSLNKKRGKDNIAARPRTGTAQKFPQAPASPELPELIALRSSIPATSVIPAILAISGVQAKTLFCLF
jgi:hypothetical protein